MRGLPAIVVVGLTLAAAGCDGTRIPAAATLATDPGEVAALDQGRTLYLSRCSGCHALIQPAAKSPREWPGEVALMAKRAKIDAAQRAAITAYLVRAAQR